MNRDDIIRMAREVADVETDSRGRDTFSFDCFQLERFAALVTVAERKACEKLCANMRYDNIEKDWSVGAAICAEAIRNQGQS